jgi:prophage DNA circulation protein
MALLDRLWQASLDGVEFLVSSDETKGGRRQAEYEYISTNRRQVQDLGQYLRKFTVTGFIPYDASNDDDYFQKRDALLTVLEADGEHNLIHPFYGEITVTTGIYSLKQRTSKLGYAEITFTATQVSQEINNSLARPDKKVTETTVTDQANQTAKSLQDDSASKFSLTKAFKDGYESAKDIASNTLQQIQDVIGPLAQEVDDAANFVKEIENDVDQINTLLNNPTSLFETIIDGITGVDGLTNDLIQADAGLKRFNEFGEAFNNFTSSTTPTDKQNMSIQALSPNVEVNENPITAKEIEIKTNSDLLTNSVQQASLIKQYDLVSQIDYESVEDINEAEQQLEQQYHKVRSNIGDSVIENFAQLRSQTRTVLDNKRLNAARERDYTAPNYTPLSVIAYQIYADSTQSDEIQKLNNIKDVIAVQGTITVLTDAINQNQ